MEIWYKLYADDLVFIAKSNDVAALLQNLF